MLSSLDVLLESKAPSWALFTLQSFSPIPARQGRGQQCTRPRRPSGDSQKVGGAPPPAQQENFVLGQSHRLEGTVPGLGRQGNLGLT